MKRLLATTLLSLVCCAANAEWVLVSVSPNSGDKYYADPTTIKRTGDVVRIWGLTEYAKSGVVGGKTYLSSKEYLQFDCSERTQQMLQFSLFAALAGGGKIVGSDNQPYDKLFLPPKSQGELMLNYACK